MSISTLSIIDILPTNGFPGITSPIGSTVSSSSTSSSISTSTSSTSSETTSLTPSTSTTTTTTSSTVKLTTSSSSQTSISEISTTSSASNTPIPSTSPPVSTSASVSPTATSNLTTIVTVVSGQTNTFTSTLPTALVTSQSNSNDLVSRRTAIIAGATTGFIALILIILGAVFIHRRHKLRKAMELSEKKREGRSLLDGEVFHDEGNIISNLPSYHDHDRRYPAQVFYGPSTLNLLKARTSESGSIFREEVWPRPGFIDPISNQSSQVDLSGIVDDVMGPSEMSGKPGNGSSLPASTNYPGSFAGSHERLQPTDPIPVSAVASSSSTSSLITDDLYSSDPFRSNFRPLIPTSSSSSSLPAAGASTPPMTGASSTVSYPIGTSASLPPSGSARSRSPNTQPQRSSPLARALTGDTSKLWLTRNVHPNRTEPAAPP